MPPVHDRFKLVSDFEVRGDQVHAVPELVDGLNRGDSHQVLLGVTGSGKTYSMAQVISRVNRPTLVMAHNKTLAAQLFQEFRRFFPDNAVEYFVSYYDYYQPEAYVPASDTYIEKESIVNEEIDECVLWLEIVIAIEPDHAASLGETLGEALELRAIFARARATTRLRLS